MSELSSTDENGHDFVDLPADSFGSSVSTRLQDEYDELMRFAVIVPTFSGDTVPKTVSDLKYPNFEDMLGQVSEANRQMSPQSIPEVLQQRAHHVDTNDDDTVTEQGLTGQSDADIESLQEEEPQMAETTPRDHHVRQGQFGKQSILHEIVTNTMEDQIMFQPHRRPSSPTESMASSRFTEDMSPPAYSGAVDPDVARMEHLLDQWTLDLKRNVLAEFGQSKIQLLEQHKHQLLREKERHKSEKNQLFNEIESLKELLHRYENSIERKDQVVSNLTRSLVKHKEKNELMKTFCEWKISHNDSKKETFAMKLASKHYDRSLTRRCYDGWHSVIENKWRTRVEKACQSKAQEICMGLTNDYETNISSLNEALEEARAEVARLHTERDRYEENMKKAFMRGVCALNMEAMSMFNESDASQPQYTNAGSGISRGPEGPYSEGDFLPPHSHTVPQEAVFSNEPPGAPLPRVVSVQSGTTSGGGGGSGLGRSTVFQQGASQPVKTQSKTFTTGTTKKGKSVTAKVSARIDSGRSRGGPSTLAPPMSSVVVERHQPVTKQTIGHATASQYPVKSQAVQKKGPGQSSDKPPPSSIHTVKLVE